MTLHTGETRIAPAAQGEMARSGLLDALLRAYACGDAVTGEHLLSRALDEGLAWDVVTAAAARGVSMQVASRRTFSASA